MSSREEPSRKTEEEAHSVLALSPMPRLDWHLHCEERRGRAEKGRPENNPYSVQSSVKKEIPGPKKRISYTFPFYVSKVKNILKLIGKLYDFAASRKFLCLCTYSKILSFPT